MERITRETLETRVENVNRRMAQAGSEVRYQVQARNGYMGLDRFRRDPAATIDLPDSVPGRGYGWEMLSTVTVGTKREVADYLHAMMTALDDANRKGEQ